MPWRGSRVFIPHFSWFIKRLSTKTAIRPKHYYGNLPNVSLLSCLQTEKINMTLGSAICRYGSFNISRNIIGSGELVLIDIKVSYTLLLEYMCRYSDKITYT